MKLIFALILTCMISSLIGSAQELQLRKDYENQCDYCWEQVDQLRMLEMGRINPSAIRAHLEHMAPYMEVWDQQNQQVKQLGIINPVCIASTQRIIAQFRQKRTQATVNQLVENMGQLSLTQKSD